MNVSLPSGAIATSVQTGVAPKDGVEQSPPDGVRFCATGEAPLTLIVIDCVAGERYFGRRRVAWPVVVGASIRIVTATEEGEIVAEPPGTEAPGDDPPSPHALKRSAAARALQVATLRGPMD